MRLHLLTGAGVGGGGFLEDREIIVCHRIPVACPSILQLKTQSCDMTPCESDRSRSLGPDHIWDSRLGFPQPPDSVNQFSKTMAFCGKI